ncbi:MAG: GGDEF domain-containing protein [Solobacterium sp.]|nr:GGDEF domain-containing protein [Solobacterium sp.]
MLGFLFFRYILTSDRQNKFGKSIVVWLAFLMLTYGASFNWIRERTAFMTREVVDELVAYYSPNWSTAERTAAETLYLNNEIEKINHSLTVSSLLQLITMGVTAVLLLSIYSIMHKKELEYARELGNTKETMYRDPLTGVKSKHAFAEKSEELNDLIEHQEMQDFAVVICDVNDLKVINDKHGHKYGDEHLKKASTTICRIYKHSPVFRIGGDEFLVILEGEDYTRRNELLETLKQTSEENIHIGLQEAVISGGMSDYRKDSDSTLAQIMERADVWMYEEKKRLKQMRIAETETKL